MFGGAALEWPRWIALFKTVVHDHADLTDVERLIYYEALRDLEKKFDDPARVI